MTKYIITADHFGGNVTCYYDGEGYMVEFAVNSWNLKRDDHFFLLERIGFLLRDATMHQWVKEQGWRYRAARIDVSFERFYTMYGYARNRIPAEKMWERLNDRQRYLVLVNLKAYIRYCKRNPLYSQMCPDTYLKSHTQDDWDKLPDFKK